MVLRKRVHVKVYTLSIVQHLTDAVKMDHTKFCMLTFHNMLPTQGVLRNAWKESDYRSIA
jgi:hypothetical protein